MPDRTARSARPSRERRAGSAGPPLRRTPPLRSRSPAPGRPQPCRLNWPDPRARAEKGGLVALALLFGERPHFDAEGQAPAGALQFAHTDHRHQDAQAAVGLDAIAPGVLVAAG